MAAQGWYPAPNEVGFLRYWDGSAWTDHRQPMPVAAPPAVAPVVTNAPGMAGPVASQDMSGAASADHLVQDLRALASEPAVRALGEGLAAAGFLTNGQNGNNNGYNNNGFNNNGGGVGFTFGAGAGGGFGNGFGGNQNGNGYNGVAASNGTDPYNGSNPSNGANQNGTPLGRRRALNPVATILIGVAVIVLGIALAVFTNNQSHVGPGEATAQGVIDDLNQTPDGTSGYDCSPTATYAVAGQKYDTNEDIGGSCNNPVGQNVTVIYSVANPSSGRLVIVGNGSALVWFVPAIGLIFIAIGVGALVKRRRAAQA